VEDYISHKEKMNEGELPMYYIEDCHEAIVDRDTFRWVQEEIKRRHREGHTAQPGIKTYCFTNRIFCRECDRTYTRATNHYKVMPPCVYWTCKTKKIKGESCSGKNLLEDALKKAVAKALGMQEFDEAVFLGRVEKIVVAKPRDIILHLYDGSKELTPEIIRAFIDRIVVHDAQQINGERVQKIEIMGFTMLPFGQGMKDMSPPTKELYKLLLEGKIAHGGNPVLRWMAGNVVVETDAAENIKPTKAKYTEKIDGIVVAIMALDRCIRNQTAHTGSVYDRRGMIVF